MKFFNIDLHISVIEDIKTIFSQLGHEVISRSLSGHTWVFNRKTDTIDIINRETWRYLDQDICDQFYNRYKDELYSYDGFIACYPPSFALLYEKFNKPIFIIAATRYEHPFSNDPVRWNWLDNKLKTMIDSGQIIPIANNKYDKFYCEHFLDREFFHIPSFCGYTQAKYIGSKESIVSGRTKIDGMLHISDLGRFEWKDLYSHQSIIHIPYNVSIMSIFEQYAANVPLLFPTIEFGKKIKGYLSELLFSPNLRINESLIDIESIKLADFYDKEWMPNIQYYDSINSLKFQIKNLSFNEVSNNMNQFNKQRKEKIIQLWRSVINV